jgi:phytol kinase
MLDHGSKGALQAMSGGGLAGTVELAPPRSVGQPAIAAPSLGRVRQLHPTEIRRRMLHMLPGFLPFILWFIPHKDPWGPILADVVLVLTVAIVGPALLRFSAFARPGEQDGRSSVLGYALPILAALCLFRGREEIGMMTLAILAFGDGSATLGGLTLGGRPLYWNPRKTVTGLSCFLIIGGLMATVVFWGEARPAITWTQAALIGGGTTLAAAIAESVRSRINDNLRVGVVSLIVGAVLHGLVIS